jgi:hypothetical protein
MAKDAPAVLKKSDNATVITAVLNPKLVRAMVRAGHANVALADGNYATAVLINAAKDTLFQNATAQNPINLGLDDILQIPVFYPSVNS